MKVQKIQSLSFFNFFQGTYTYMDNTYTENNKYVST